jgi:hypothetical protein
MTRPDQFYAELVAQMYSLLRTERFDPAPYAAFVGEAESQRSNSVVVMVNQSSN